MRIYRTLLFCSLAVALLSATYGRSSMTSHQRERQEPPPVPGHKELLEPLFDLLPSSGRYDEWEKSYRPDCWDCARQLPSLEGDFPTVKRTRGANSQIPLPNNLILADIDADGNSDYLQYVDNKIFVSKTDFEKTGILHAYLDVPIQRVVTGDFFGDHYDQVCTIMTDGSFACFGISPDRKELWWAFTQGTFIAPNEDFIVGDFNGDRRDDILVYNRSSGQMRMYTRDGSGFFNPMRPFALGNLEHVARPGIQLRAGDFNGDGRTDIMAINQWGQILYYGSVFDGTNNTFWWAFTTNSGLVGTRDQVTVAKIDNNSTDDVVIHNMDSGHNRFLRMEWVGGNLAPITNVSQGQISTEGNSRLFWGWMKAGLSEPGIQRDDALVYLNASGMFVRSDARWDGAGYTYWWAYTHRAPNNHYGWAPIRRTPWLIIKCKFRDRPAEPQNNRFFRELFTADGWDGVVAYWRDLSYGSFDLRGNTLDDRWFVMSQTLEEARSLGRYGITEACRAASGKDASAYYNVIALVNDVIDSGFQVRVLLDPLAWNVTIATHEMGHAYGWGHSFDDTNRRAAEWSQPGEYFDNWDIMSAMNVWTFLNHNGLAAGPEMNAPYKTKMNFIPSQRIVRLSPNPSSRRSQTFKVAALNKPEANGALMIRIGDSDADYYTLEFRMRAGWDQGIPRDTVLIHRVRGGVSYLITAQGGAERQPGSVYVAPNGVRIITNSFNRQAMTASVTVEY